MIGLSPEQLSGIDIARMNLLCATDLPGAEEMDVEKYLRRLDALADLASRLIHRNLPRFREDPSAFPLPAGSTEAQYCIWEMICVLKVDAGSATTRN